MAKKFYAQRLPHETINEIKRISIETGKSEADVIANRFVAAICKKAVDDFAKPEGILAQQAVPTGFEFVGRKPTATEISAKMTEVKDDAMRESVGKSIGVPLVKRIDAALAGSKRTDLKSVVSKPKSRVVDLFSARKPILKPGHKTL